MVISSRLIERYQELKGEVPGCILLMQVGAFMQVQGEDAKVVAGVTGLKLVMAGEVDRPVVAGGFPRSGLERSLSGGRSEGSLKFSASTPGKLQLEDR